jgi:hypothetical protein
MENLSNIERNIKKIISQYVTKETLEMTDISPNHIVYLLQEGRTIVNDDCTQELQDYLSQF